MLRIAAVFLVGWLVGLSFGHLSQRDKIDELRGDLNATTNMLLKERQDRMERDSKQFTLFEDAIDRLRADAKNQNDWILRHQMRCGELPTLPPQNLPIPRFEEWKAGQGK